MEQAKINIGGCGGQIDWKAGEMPAFAWPGGYPIVYYSKDCEAFCPDCVNTEPGMHAGDDPDWFNDDWHVVGCDVYCEGPDMYCANCNKAIESAYGDPEEVTA